MKTLTDHGVKVSGTKAIMIEAGDNKELRKSLEEKEKGGIN